ncbi:MAG: Hsp20/alpha crystallin family protein [Planctomycetota bacterium]|nr:Hsp20/alpha crystallin family protein [Planctomycetota bacterium]
MRLIPWTREDQQNRLGRFFNDFFVDEWRPGEWMPAVDVMETDDSVVARAEIPGMDADDIEISIVNDTLILRGEKLEETHKENENWERVERRYGKFVRTIPLPSAVDFEKAKAEVEKGVLTVTMAKHEGVRPRKIKIKEK